ncbi:hypothetical protein RB195_003536 [Necator americanus]|uniref:Uncharacterized protein n=1 Tax=Necator americanus TaxID=51031 RepID=A0ABR1DQC6_NECAM
MLRRVLLQFVIAEVLEHVLDYTMTCGVQPTINLIKTHKLKPDEINSTSAATFKMRPIISCVGGPTDRISFLNKIVYRLKNAKFLF